MNFLIPFLCFYIGFNVSMMVEFYLDSKRDEESLSTGFYIFLFFLGGTMLAALAAIDHFDKGSEIFPDEEDDS